MKRKIGILLCILVLAFASIGLTACNETQNKGFVEQEMITMDQAIDIVLSRVDGASIDNIEEIEIDEEHGRMIYEGSLFYNGIEYEFEIDGQTGNIIEWEIDD